MNEHERRGRGLLSRLVAEWLEDRTGRPLGAVEPNGSGGWTADLGGVRVAIEVESVGGAPSPAGWSARLDAFAYRLTVLPGGSLVWLPAGADLPEQEPSLSATVGAVDRALAALAAGEAGEAALPIVIGVTKRDESGAYVSAFGGLAQHWARFTDRVRGYFTIDGRDLHRLPAGNEYIEALVERLVEASAGLETGNSTAIDAEDHWRVQRLRGGDGIAVIGIPPADESEVGASLRKRLRLILRELNQREREPGTLRVLGLYGRYPSLADEPVGAALRGQDPSLFGGLDLAVLVADAQIRPLIDVSRRAELRPSTVDAH